MLLAWRGDSRNSPRCISEPFDQETLSSRCSCRLRQPSAQSESSYPEFVWVLGCWGAAPTAIHPGSCRVPAVLLSLVRPSLILVVPGRKSAAVESQRTNACPPPVGLSS